MKNNELVKADYARIDNDVYQKLLDMAVNSGKTLQQSVTAAL